MQVFDSLGWTDAQKRLVDHYEPGLQLRFVKTTAHFKAGETVTVLDRVGRQLQVRGSDRHERLFSPSRAPSSFEVGDRREIGVAAGDVLLLRANAKDFVNGERVEVKSVQRERITLTDGRELPRDYRTFTHGYAVTSHAAQGKTVDEVMVVASSRSFPAVSQEQFYVSISRARERARIYTDDAELLRRRVEDSHTRKAAIELEGLREALRLAGYRRTREEEDTKRTERERQTETERASERQTRTERVEQTIRRVVRQVRALRVERLAPVERIARTFRQWMDQKFGVEQTQRVAQRETMTQQVTQRQSRGIHM